MLTRQAHYQCFIEMSEPSSRKQRKIDPKDVGVLSPPVAQRDESRQMSSKLDGLPSSRAKMIDTDDDDDKADAADDDHDDEQADEADEDDHEHDEGDNQHEHDEEDDHYNYNYEGDECSEDSTNGNVDEQLKKDMKVSIVRGCCANLSCTFCLQSGDGTSIQVWLSSTANKDGVKVSTYILHTRKLSSQPDPCRLALVRALHAIDLEWHSGARWGFLSDFDEYQDTIANNEKGGFASMKSHAEQHLHVCAEGNEII